MFSINHDTFLADTRRAPYLGAEFYGIIFVAPGQMRPVIERFRAYGVNFTRNRTNHEVVEELARADRDMTEDRLKGLAKAVVPSYAIRPASMPVRGLRPIYSNNSFLLYKL